VQIYAIVVRPLLIYANKFLEIIVVVLIESEEKEPVCRSKQVLFFMKYASLSIAVPFMGRQLIQVLITLFFICEELRSVLNQE